MIASGTKEYTHYKQTADFLRIICGLLLTVFLLVYIVDLVFHIVTPPFFMDLFYLDIGIIVGIVLFSLYIGIFKCTK